jgi:signal transduction histidine kinase
MNIHLKYALPDPERAEASELEKQSRYFEQFPFLVNFIDAIPIPVMVLNRQRQVVYSNKVLLDITGKKNISSIFGMRPGEIFSCMHAYAEPDGCGSTEFCSTCGALKAIISTSQDNYAVEETRIIKAENEALDLKVHSSPLKIGDELFTIYAVTDISDEKRRKNLERIFFHDLLNTASSVKALAYNLENAGEKDSEEFKSHLVKLSDKLVDEISAQRDIYAAENNELAVYLSRANTLTIMNDIYEQFNHNGRSVKVQIDPSSDNCDFFTDKILIRRTLSNMVKNAIEATPDNGIVKIGCRRKDENVEIWVHNEGYISKEIQLQIFQRSFSTKGFGRGIGTYSMKLLCERYLKGKVSFTSTKTEGTIFYCRVPLNLD